MERSVLNSWWRPLDVIRIRHHQLLRGMKLGYDIRDTCFSENIGLDEMLDLIISGEHLSLRAAHFLGKTYQNPSPL